MENFFFFKVQHTILLIHLNRFPQRESCRKLTFVRCPWQVELGVEAAVDALPALGQRVLLEAPVQHEGAAPVDVDGG